MTDDDRRRASDPSRSSDRPIGRGAATTDGQVGGPRAERQTETQALTVVTAPAARTLSVVARAWVGDRVATLAHVLNGQQDGFACVGQRLFRRLALAVATGEGGHDGDIAAFGIGLENHVVAGLFHIPSLSCPLTTGHHRVQSVQDLRYTRPRKALTPSD